MNGRMTRVTRSVLAVGTGFVVAAAVDVPAVAQDGTWTVSPGGPIHGETIDVLLMTFQETGIQLFCVSSAVDGTTDSGSGLTNPLAVIPEAAGFVFTECQGPLRYRFGMAQVGDWHLYGDTYDGIDVVTGRIPNVLISINGAGCKAKLTGRMDVTYTNTTDRLSVLPNFTLLVSYVDPAANCLGLFVEGDHLSFDADFQVAPDLTVTSP